MRPVPATRAMPRDRATSEVAGLVPATWGGRLRIAARAAAAAISAAPVRAATSAVHRGARLRVHRELSAAGIAVRARARTAVAVACRAVVVAAAAVVDRRYSDACNSMVDDGPGGAGRDGRA